MSKVIWVVVLIVVVALLWFLFRGDSSGEPEAMMEDEKSEIAPPLLPEQIDEAPDANKDEEAS